jgi:betaine-homocysteine S-methyltransferase
VKKLGILDRLKKGVVMGAEGYVFELEKRGYIKAGPFVPEVVLDYPEAVLELHREFLRAGSEVAVALTYYAHREKLKTIGREKDLEKMNRQAVRLAKKAAKPFNALVAGNICNTWAYDPKNPQKSGAIVRKMYQEQVKWAVEEGVDFIIAETNDYLEEALIGLEVIKSYSLPAMVTLASVQKSKTRDGYDYVKACQILEEKGADIVGLNCDRGPATMLPLIKKVRQSVSCFIAAQPVPYKTTASQLTFESLKRNGSRVFPLSLETFQLTRWEMAEFAKVAKLAGVNYIGICCGGGPHQVRAMAEALGRTPPASKYSPAMELHPMLGNKVKLNDKEKFLTDWKDNE